MKHETNPQVLGIFKALLGLEEPWRIVSVQLVDEPKRVDIEVEWPASFKPVCPQCARACAIYDHAGARWWRHLDTMGHVTRLCCRVPRCECTEHGVRTVQVPWAGENARFTEEFECRAIELLLCAASQKQASVFLGMSWSQTHNIQSHAVQRGLKERNTRQIKRAGIDEKSFGKAHHYGTLLSDLDGRCVIDVVEHRTEQSAESALESLGQAQREKLEVIAMDMWPAYMAAAATKAPQADIVHDRFHVMKHLNEAVDTVRKREHAVLSEQANDWLTGRKYLFLKSPDTWKEEERKCFAELQKKDLQVTKAWGLRENFQRIWQFATPEGAGAFFRQWQKRVNHLGLQPVCKKADMLKSHLRGLLNYATHTITNAVAEGFNSKIQTVKSAARGFRRFENYRIAILFHCGKLNLYPL